MHDIDRAAHALQNPHTRRALFIGTPLLAVAFAAAVLIGSREWLLLRATAIWLVGIAVVIQWRLAPLLREVPARRAARPIERFGRHPLGAFVLGIVGTAPLAALGPLFDRRTTSMASSVVAWQVAGFVAAFVGGLAGLAVWDASVGRAARRRRNSARGAA